MPGTRRRAAAGASAEHPARPAGPPPDGALRAAVTDCARRMAGDGLVIGTSGNVSARAGEAILITPSGRGYDSLGADDLCVIGLDGRPVDCPHPPSSELPMHLAVYRATDAAAVVHTHSMFATAVAAALTELPPVHYAITALGGPVRVAPYATFGTAELADGLAAALAGRRAALLASHGAVTVGRSVAQAYERARLLEWLAELYYRAAQLGRPRLLSQQDLDAVTAQAALLARRWAAGGARVGAGPPVPGQAQRRRAHADTGHRGGASRHDRA